ncbi:NADH-ubiquinone oxidoreductase subunit [Arthroderma uncinatum]|uniref:NADH-ubiquinone oxidoreductase subunit n=1 Tax=Arthroderma uncinatum TaxID=74035 RepID=UPI00144A9881|nr:NADH-ubiquinone oxidoreductase subunit [Arthroderma uncinatum]KAF3490498.1 NADH-ubiquinone oxidoreductase subunit [Arthroderma uncinatum]
MAGLHEAPMYQPQDALTRAINTTMMTGSVGLFTSAVQNTLQKQNVGPWGIFTRTGSTIFLFAAMGGSYEFVKTASANLREKEDHWNAIYGGFAAGSLIGFRARTFPAVIGYGVALATVLGTFEFTGGSLRGKEIDRTVDEYDRRTALRKNFRSPGEETIAELGEGRGIEGPGYAERRRERIKQNYGIDVPVTQASASP